MRGAVLVALAATVGNLLQGWDNSVIAGSVIYIKREFNLQGNPTVEGLIIAMSIIGGTLVTTFSGPISDEVGRRPMLIISSVCYFLSGIVMSWAPNVYILILARLIEGFGIGLAVTLVPLYISETAPSEIRGQLNTLPQFCGSGGMFLSYCMVFGMSLMDSPSWRLMLGLLSIPSLAYMALMIFFLPESPRWLVSKGRMVEARKVLQRLRGVEDVSGELALLIEGLDIGAETCIEEYIITPANELAQNQETIHDKNQIRLYGVAEGQSWVAKNIPGQSTLSSIRRGGSMVSHSVPLMDPIVTLFGSVHSVGTGTRSMLFPNLGSMLSAADYNNLKNEEWDMDSQKDIYASDDDQADLEENLRSPLLSRQATSVMRDAAQQLPKSSNLSTRNSSLMHSNVGASYTDIGGGWQLAYKYSDKTGEDGKKEGGVQRVFLHQEGGSRFGSMASFSGPRGAEIPVEGSIVHAAALVSHRALVNPRVGSSMIHPSETTAKGPSWRDLLEPGVKRALFVGVGLQVLQQIAGINGVLYYTPQILKEAGVSVLLSNIGLNSDSASLLISTFTTLCMLPCIFLSMKLMDVSGRRFLLLTTIPILIVSLLGLVLSSVLDMGSVVNATISTLGVVFYLSCFVMGFGVIPNILCAEIFPTRVRGLCITITSLTYWIGNIIITYSVPALLKAIGLAGVFSIFCVGCIISWIFIFLKVPETKGMPLEVITEFFAVGSKQTSDSPLVARN